LARRAPFVPGGREKKKREKENRKVDHLPAFSGRGKKKKGRGRVSREGEIGYSLTRGDVHKEEKKRGGKNEEREGSSHVIVFPMYKGRKRRKRRT